MIVKTYSGEQADWVHEVHDPASNDGQTHLRILWTEEKLSLEDLEKLAEEGYIMYVTDQRLLKEDGPGFAHSMAFTPKG